LKNAPTPEVLFVVRVTPRASRTRFAGLMQDGEATIYKIAIAAPPIDGRANAELISWLASILNVPRSAIEVTAGEHSRNKRVRVSGRTLLDIENAFKPDNNAGLP
jgi:uncharacterized protein